MSYKCYDFMFKFVYVGNFSIEMINISKDFVFLLTLKSFLYCIVYLLINNKSVLYLFVAKFCCIKLFHLFRSDIKFL